MLTSYGRPCGGNGGARSLASAALGLAGLGHPVFQAAPRDKAPLISRAEGGRGCHDATTDAAQIQAWWESCPPANVCLGTGRSCWVLDVDGEEGLATLADLEDRQRWLPKTVASVTGGGGMHLFFAADERVRNSVRRLGPGLDTRGTGGYVVAPPSVHPNGNAYCWLTGRSPWDRPLEPAPAWLLDLLAPPEPATHRSVIRKPPLKARTSYVRKAVESELANVAMAGKGGRNAALFKASAALGRFVEVGELRAAEIGPALVDAALAAGLPRHEAEATTMSGLKSAAKGAS